MKLRSGCSTTKTSGSMGKSYWKNGGKGGSSPKQLRQHGTPTCNSTGTRAATHNSPPSGTSGASTSAAPIGAMSLSGPRHPRQPHRRPRPSSVVSCFPCGRQGLTSSRQNDSDSDEDNDEDSDDDEYDMNNKVAEILAKEARRLARRRANRARYRARHPDRVAEQKRQYRARHPDRVAEQRRRYYAKNRDRIVEQRRRYRERCRAYIKEYYKERAERIRAHKRYFYRSEAGQRWQKQYLVRKRESAALLRRQRGPMVQKTTEEKRQALGPLKLTVTLEDFMKDFHDSLSPSPEDSVDQPSTLMDMDSGVFHPLDYSVVDESSLSSCDMWDDGKGFLDNLVDDLPSSSDDSLLNNLLEELEDLSSSDDCLFDFLIDRMEDNSSFDLDDFVS